MDGNDTLKLLLPAAGFAIGVFGSAGQCVLFESSCEYSILAPRSPCFYTFGQGWGCSVVPAEGVLHIYSISILYIVHLKGHHVAEIAGTAIAGHQRSS